MNNEIMIFQKGDGLIILCKYIHNPLYRTTKRNITLKQEKGYKGFTIGSNSNPFPQLVEIIELRKGVIVWLHRGVGLERHSTYYKNATPNVNQF